MIFALLLFVVGVFLSAFFSGSETGFYRATRVRLTMDAISGNYVAKGLMWLTNNPALFVATTLIGNNLANYLTSLAIVLASVRVFPINEELIGAVAPIVFSPVVFVYGELLPKNLFYQAPNRLLRLGGPLFMFCCVLFMPVSVVLWLLGRGLQYVVGEAPEQIQTSLARKELHRVFDEGHEVGLLRPTQRRLAQEMLTLAKEPLDRYATSVARLPSVPKGVAKSEVYRLTRRQKQPTVLVTEPHGRRIIGYVHVLDLKLQPGDVVDSVRTMIEISKTESPVSALMRMESSDRDLARLVDERGRTIGILGSALLLDQLLRRAS